MIFHFLIIKIISCKGRQKKGKLAPNNEETSKFQCDKILEIQLVLSFFIFSSAREVELAIDAKKGLESKEDIHGASKGLRVTEKNKKTGVGTEKTNPYDGVKEVMFFHIKGLSPNLFLSY